jgi:hypothetical protein
MFRPAAASPRERPRSEHEPCCSLGGTFKLSLLTGNYRRRSVVQTIDLDLRRQRVCKDRRETGFMLPVTKPELEVLLTWLLDCVSISVTTSRIYQTAALLSRQGQAVQEDIAGVCCHDMVTFRRYQTSLTRSVSMLPSNVP